MDPRLVRIAEAFGDSGVPISVGGGDADTVPSRFGPGQIVSQKPVHSARLNHRDRHPSMMPFLLVRHKNKRAGSENLTMDPDPSLDRNQGMIPRSAAQNPKKNKQ